MAELPEALRTLHARGVKGYVTFNTLIFDDELQAAARALAAIAEAGADAILVQDWAAVALARRIAPDLEIHGSTQMSITSVEGVRHAQALGVRRMILARELSLDEIRRSGSKPTLSWSCSCTARCAFPIPANVSLRKPGEAAAPIAASARKPAACPMKCWSMAASSPWATRATCFRPAICTRWNKSRRSCEIGISALKIEGRYKDAEYVALTTRAYRKAVDDAWAGREQPGRDQHVDRSSRTGTSLFARARSIFLDRDQSPDSGERPRAPASRAARRPRDACFSHQCRGESGIRSRHPAL